MDTKVQCTKYVEKLRAATGKISLETKKMKRAEISARQIEKKKITNYASVRKEEKRGWDCQMHSFVLVFVGQGVGERTYWPIPVAQTHSQLNLEVSL